VSEFPETGARVRINRGRFAGKTGIVGNVDMSVESAIYVNVKDDTGHVIAASWINPNDLTILSKLEPRDITLDPEDMVVEVTSTVAVGSATATLYTAINAARNLILDADGSYPGDNPEYVRGIVGLIADTFLIGGIADGEQKRQAVYKLIGATE